MNFCEVTKKNKQDNDMPGRTKKICIVWCIKINHQRSNIIIAIIVIAIVNVVIAAVVVVAFVVVVFVVVVIVTIITHQCCCS